MTKWIVFVAMVLLFTMCKNNNSRLPADYIHNTKTADGTDSSKDMPLISFKKTEHDFGKVIQGELVSYGFRFTNSGKTDLIISSVTSSCGCTVSSYPSRPIKPGESEIIEAKFDSNNRLGFQNKRITVLTNSEPAKHILNITAEVIKP
jgi:hypothetical protein